MNLCTIHFYDLLANIETLRKIASGKMIVESLQSKALTKSLRSPLEKREKTSVIMM